MKLDYEEDFFDDLSMFFLLISILGLILALVVAFLRALGFKQFKILSIHDILTDHLSETVTLTFAPKYVDVNVTDYLANALSELVNISFIPKYVDVTISDYPTNYLSENVNISLLPKTIDIIISENLTDFLSESVAITLQ